jgi:hypothetical protein
MSAFGSGSIANYSTSPLTEGYAKKVISHQGANGQLVISSADRLGGTWAAPKTQPFNSFTVQKGFPIQQGQIMNVKLTEVLFPYAIPNVNEYNNKFFIQVRATAGRVIIVPTGFYTGTSLATTINALVALVFPGHSPVLVFNPDGTYTWSGATSSSVDDFALLPVFSTPVDVANPGVGVLNAYLTTPLSTQCMLSVLGFSPTYQDFTTMGNVKFSQVAPLIYTSYIDICSDVLTQYQDLPDASTATPNNQHIICRLYIANEVSTVLQDASGNPIYPGMSPFVIHRQFKNPKVMKWNSQNSIDRIDIQLFDDAGRPLYQGTRGNSLGNNNVCTWDDFAITFHSAE